MRITNTTANALTLTFANGEAYAVLPSDHLFLDDSAVVHLGDSQPLLDWVAAGSLVVTASNGSPWSGAPIPTQLNVYPTTPVHITDADVSVQYTMLPEVGVNGIPATTGQKTSANSTSVVLASDDTVVQGVGTDAAGVAVPAGGSGIRGWLSGIYSKLSGSLSVTGTFWQATQPVSAASLPLPTGAAQDGTDATGVVQISGGVGIRGWLSGIFSRLGGILSVSNRITGNVVTLMSGVTAMSSGASQSVPYVHRVYQASVTGTGAVSAQVTLDFSADNVNWAPALLTIVLPSGATSVSYGIAVDHAWAYVRANVTAITGINATVTVVAQG